MFRVIQAIVLVLSTVLSLTVANTNTMPEASVMEASSDDTESVKQIPVAGAIEVVSSYQADESVEGAESSGSSLYAGVTKDMASMLKDAKELRMETSNVEVESTSSTEKSRVKDVMINETDYTMYASELLNVRKKPSKKSEKLGVLKTNTKIRVIGEIEGSKFVQIEYKNKGKTNVAYVHSAYLSKEKVDTYDHQINGERLTSSKGVMYDKYGFRLSYYNLPMNKCISVMRSMGYQDEVWVDQYGYKMMGEYIMAAGQYPKGTIVTCSQGNCIIVDHGEFEATYGKMALDLCTVW